MPPTRLGNMHVSSIQPGRGHVAEEQSDGQERDGHGPLGQQQGADQEDGLVGAAQGQRAGPDPGDGARMGTGCVGPGRRAASATVVSVAVVGVCVVGSCSTFVAFCGAPVADVAAVRPGRANSTPVVVSAGCGARLEAGRGRSRVWATRGRRWGAGGGAGIERGRLRRTRGWVSHLWGSIPGGRTGPAPHRGGSTVSHDADATTPTDRAPTSSRAALIVPRSGPSGRPDPPAVPTGRPADGLEGDGSFTVDCADCAHRTRRCATTASCRSSSVGSPTTPWWSTPTRPGPSGCSARAGLVPGVRHEAQASGL